MKQIMPGTDGPDRKLSTTNVTLERLLAIMSSQVLIQALLQLKVRFAMSTRERAFVAVLSKVLTKLALGRKTFGTSQTLKRSLPSVQSHVYTE